MTLLSTYGQRKLLDVLTPNWDYTPVGAYNLPVRFYPRTLNSPNIKIGLHGVESLKDWARISSMYDPTINAGPIPGGVGKWWGGYQQVSPTAVADLSKWQNEVDTIVDNFRTRNPNFDIKNIRISPTPTVPIGDVVQDLGKTMVTSMHPQHIASNLEHMRAMRMGESASLIPVLTGTATHLANASKWLIPGAMLAHGAMVLENPELRESTPYNLLTQYGPETYLGLAAASEAPNILRNYRGLKLMSPSGYAENAPLVMNMIKKNIGKIGLGYGALALARHFLVSKKDKELEKTSSLDSLAAKGQKLVPIMAASGIIGWALKDIYDKAAVPPQVATTAYGRALLYSDPMSMIGRSLAFGTPEVTP